MNAARALLYARTLSSLRPVQVFDRVWRRLRTSRPNLSPAPNRRPHGPFLAFAGREASLVGPRRFRFLGEEREIATASDWNAPNVSKLWLYNLHYFDDLRAEDTHRRAHWHGPLIERWIDENPPAEGNGWEPYTTSLRLVNWIRHTLAGGELPQGADHSLAVQARWLRANLEHHLLGNHLFANAKALVFAGFYFDGDEARGWLDRGLAILESELTEQILPDGGHFERSPMYHAIILEDLLDLLALTRAFEGAETARLRYAPKRWTDVANRMRRWLHCMTHGDGGPAFFNDCAFGVALSLEHIEAYARELELPSITTPTEGAIVLPDSGYVRYQKDGVLALLDVGEIGPGYLPGHAHADTLSFELSLGEERIAVNSGTSTYRVCPEREHQRSTRAHNTVEVDGLDSSEVWASFRVARRAHPVGLVLDNTPDGFEVRCAHDGYRRLPGKVLHRRAWLFQDDALHVSDRIDGAHDRAVARIHLHPDVSVDGARLQTPSRALEWSATGATPRVTQSTWHPRFGASQSNACLELDLEARGGELSLRW